MAGGLIGGCNCGALKVEFATMSELAPRACQCGFCRRQGARMVSDPEGSAVLTLGPEARRYRFGTMVTDFLCCGRCGVYVGEVQKLDGRTFATNLNVFDDPHPELEAVPVSYDGETAEASRAPPPQMDAGAAGRGLRQWAARRGFIESRPGFVEARALFACLGGSVGQKGESCNGIDGKGPDGRSGRFSCSLRQWRDEQARGSGCRADAAQPGRRPGLCPGRAGRPRPVDASRCRRASPSGRARRSVRAQVRRPRARSDSGRRLLDADLQPDRRRRGPGLCGLAEKLCRHGDRPSPPCVRSRLRLPTAMSRSRCSRPRS